MTLRQDLIHTKSIINTPEKWRKGSMPYQSRCAGDAIDKMICIDLGHQQEYISRADVILGALGFKNLSELVLYNDDPTTTHLDIMKRFDDAIAKLSDEEV